MQFTIHAERAVIWIHRTFIEQDGPVKSFNNVQYRYVFRGPGQRYATARTARCVDDSRNGKLRDDLGQKGGRDLLFLGDDRSGCFLVSRQLGKKDDGSQVVIGLEVDLNDKYSYLD